MHNAPYLQPRNIPLMSVLTHNVSESRASPFPFLLPSRSASTDEFSQMSAKEDMDSTRNNSPHLCDLFPDEETYYYSRDF